MQGLAPPRSRPAAAKHDRKALQLCRQVQRALSLALAGECGDDVLRELLVEEVLPAPDASRLLVRLGIPPRVEDVSTPDILQRLARVHGQLRHSVAQAITRKRAPELTFVPVAMGGAGQGKEVIE